MGFLDVVKNGVSKYKANQALHNDPKWVKSEISREKDRISFERQKDKLATLRASSGFKKSKSDNFGLGSIGHSEMGGFKFGGGSNFGKTESNGLHLGSSANRLEGIGGMGGSTPRRVVHHRHKARASSPKDRRMYIGFE